jgi:predicted permease
MAPVIFMIVMILSLIVSLFLATLLFSNQKDRSIATVASIIGNTGNLGIPLGIALFGEASVIYTSIINLANVFFVYIVGVYFYARGEFSIKESIKKIFKLPAIWFGFIALIFNYLHLKTPDELLLPMQM